MRHLFLYILVCFAAVSAGAQIYDHPNYSLSSHPSLSLTSIERWEDRTILHISLTNERVRASFCIDPATYLNNAMGEETFRLEKMEGIPACPQQHRFTAVGEVLSFRLVFPPVPDEIRYLHLEEQCRDECVSLRYILLDEALNERINEGFLLYENGRLNAAQEVFERILEESYDDYSPVFGTLYLYLMYIHFENSDRKALRSVYDQLKASNILGKVEFITSARETGLIR